MIQRASMFTTMGAARARKYRTPASARALAIEKKMRRRQARRREQEAFRRGDEGFFTRGANERDVI